MSTLKSIIRGVKPQPHFVLLYGVDGVGKCLGKGTPVMLADGSRIPVESIRRGDQLMGPDSRPRTVLGTNRGLGPLYKVECNKGDSFVCNDAHLLTVANSNDKHRGWFEISAAEYSRLPDHKRRYLTGVRVPVEFPESVLPLDPYFVGLWIGDGTLRGASIRITKPEKEIHAAVCAQAESYGLRGKRYNDNSDRCGGSGVISYERGESTKPFPPKFKAAMMEIGWNGEEKTIPDHYLKASRDQRLHLLAGLIDTDGHHVHGCFEISTKYERLSKSICWLARSLGLQTTCRLKKSTIKEIDFTGYYYRVFISGHTDIVPTRNPKKQATPRTQIKNPNRFGMKVTPIGDGEYFGFEVDGDHRFLLGDFTVTHNSTFGAEAPSPIFLGPEDGLGMLDVPRFPTPKTWADIKASVNDLLMEDHEFETLVIDTIDWIEPMIWAYLCKEEGVKSIEQVGGGFGKGYVLAREQTLEFVKSLMRLRKKMNVIALAHALIKTTEDPYAGERYDRYLVKMNDQAAGIWREAVDCVLFANFKTSFSKAKGAAKAKAQGDGKRVIFTERRPAFDAKNRFNLPFEMELSWKEFASAAAAALPSSADTTDKMMTLFKGIEDQATAYLVAIEWLEEGQPLTDLRKVNRDKIFSRPEGFLAAVKKHAEKAPKPETTETNE